MIEARERGVYRHERVDGTVEFFVHDHNRACIWYARGLTWLADEDAEAQFRCFLNKHDPLAPSGAADPASYIEYLKAG